MNTKGEWSLSVDDLRIAGATDQMIAWFEEIYLNGISWKDETFEP